MSLFDKPPANFPFRIDPSEQPIEYTLKTDTVDRAVVVFLAGLWAFVGTFIVWSVGWELFSAMFGATLSGPAAIILTVGFLAGWAYYIWPKICLDYRTVDIEIANRTVNIHLKEPLRQEKWSDPLETYEGVAQVNLGNHDLGTTKRNVSSIVLKHPDPEKSVPIAIEQQTQIGKKTVQRFAEALDLPVLDGIGDQTGAQAYEEGTLVRNDRKALILRLVCWAPLAITGLIVLTALPGVISTGEDYEWMLAVIPAVAAVTFVLQIFSSFYVTRMREWQGDIWIRTGAIIVRDYKFEPGSFTSAKHYEGRSNNGQHSPWIGLSVEGRYFPFVIDLQADFVDEKKIYALPKTD